MWRDLSGDAKCVGDGGEPEVWVLQTAFCVVPKAAVMAVTGPMGRADEVHV